MLKVLLIGCGFMGRMHASVYGTLDSAKLVGAVDTLVDRAEGIAQGAGARAYASWEEALANEDFDAVDICLPTDLHREYTEKAARAGKHVLCEKPMALLVSDAEAMISTCEQHNVRLMIAHCIRFWPEYALLKKLRDDRSLGRLLSVNFTRYGEFPHWSADNWLADEDRAGGAALDMHIHDTDFARFLCGAPMEVVSFGTDDGRGIGQIFTTMTFEDGVVAHLEGGWNLPPKTPFKMAFRAIFERGAAIMDGGPMTIYSHDADPYTPEFPKMQAAGGGNISDMGGYYHEIAYFVDCVLTGKPFEITTASSSRDSLATALNEIEQAKCRTVPLRDSTKD